MKQITTDIDQVVLFIERWLGASSKTLVVNRT